jgi:hypothetical protein
MRKLFHHAAQQSHSEFRRAAIGLVSDVETRVVPRPVQKPTLHSDDSACA